MIYFSHPGKLLKEHLRNVGNNIKRKIVATNLSKAINKEIIKQIGYLIGISHDFGKYTIYFQNHLKGEDNQYSKHSLLSAIFTYFNVKTFLKDKIEEKSFKYMPLIAFQIVKHHHGNLQSIDDNIDFSFDTSLKKQVEYIKNTSIKDFSDLYPHIKIEQFCSLFNRHSDEYETEIKYELEREKWNYKFREKDEKLKYYYFIINQFLYSLLISYDKVDASETDVKESILNIDSDIVSRYKKEKFNITEKYIKTIQSKEVKDLTLYEMKERIYQDVLTNLDKVDLNNNRIFTITAPTGSGKTITSFAVALKIKEKIKDYQSARIIYSLPFTSLIEQNYSVIKEILSLLPEFKYKENLYLLKHHYFSDITYKTDNEKLPIEKALLHIENWDSTVIVTTFIQLFYTLIGYKNRMLKKFHNIANSIIILDEIQNIPIKYWKIINYILKLLAEYFNVYIILLTATKPLIFDESEAVELLINNEEYFNNLNRVKLRYENNINDLDDLFETLAKDKYAKKMVILNTIKSTIDLFEKIKNDNRFSEYSKIYLSSNITPFERKKRIEKINAAEKLIIVTTQLVEAGVDIDVDVIYRDMAPMDSIIQSCGRCNRKGDENKIGDVVVMEIKNPSDNNKFYWKYIYDKILVDECTKKNLYKEIGEDNFMSMIDTFFIDAKRKMSMETSCNLLEAIKWFNFSKLDEFKLIENLPIYVNVFIELDYASRVWKKFNDEVLSLYKNRIGDWHIKARMNFFKIKGEFYQYVINMPKDIAAKVCEPTEWEDLYVLPNKMVNNKENKIYDSEELSGVGFIREVKEWII